MFRVALRKESVDRNKQLINKCCKLSRVALRKESVDRNTSIDNITQGVFKSLSARRAWIEMLIFVLWTAPNRVALRKESVDRNNAGRESDTEERRSLSARRAWIEMRVNEDRYGQQ